MAIDVNDEILQDFLVEAGEILELLGEQLVELEQTPEDPDLLNAVFRGFHTVKGGAGFLGIDNLVETCHRAEDVFNLLRQGQRQVTPDLMDVILQVLDVVNAMFEDVRNGQEPAPADRGLISRLEALAVPAGTGPAATAPMAAATPVPEPPPTPPAAAAAPPPPSPPQALDEEPPDPVSGELDALLNAAQESLAAGEAEAGADEIAEEEFDALLDELHGPGRHQGVPPNLEADPSAESAVAPAPTESDEISEEEFDALLDELHGPGQHLGVPVDTEATPPAEPVAAPAPAETDEISEEEFDALLDELHGPGRHLGVPEATGADPAPGVPAESVPQVSHPDPAPQTSAAEPAPQVTQVAPAEPPPVAVAVAAGGSQTVVTAAPAATEAPAAQIPSQGPPQPAPVKPAAAHPRSSGETTVRVDTQRLDDIMNMVGELVLVRNRLATLKSAMADEELANAVGNLDVVTADLQLAVMKTRMQPIRKVFGRFPRVVRDLARSLHREVDLVMEGEDTDLDKNLVEALADPMVHLVRNAVDHGIEAPELREARGKPRQGRVLLSASQEGDHILLSIEDDGKGMDPDALRRKAVEKGLMDPDAAARLDEKDAFNLIFQPGFSTKTEISDVSGRGVGMDVVKTRIAQMNGTVEIDSILGKGTKITVKLPLTLAILPTLMVVLSRQPFALPLASVVEIFNLDLSRTNLVDNQLTIRVRERALPLFYLRSWLAQEGYGTPEYAEGEGYVVVVNVANLQVGLVVDDLIGQEEVVIKPLGALLQGLEGMAGATITGDGKIALILDVPGLMRKYARRY